MVKLQLSVHALQASNCLSDCINEKYRRLFLGNITMGEKSTLRKKPFLLTK